MVLFFLLVTFENNLWISINVVFFNFSPALGSQSQGRFTAWTGGHFMVRPHRETQLFKKEKTISHIHAKWELPATLEVLPLDGGRKSECIKQGMETHNVLTGRHTALTTAPSSLARLRDCNLTISKRNISHWRCSQGSTADTTGS